MNKIVEIKIQRISDVKLPEYAHDGDAGMDIYSSVDCVLRPGEKQLIKTGISIAIPNGYVGLIWDRSGMALKHSLHVLAGVVDSGYRGEVGVVIINLSDKEFEITKDMRVAQMLIQPVASVQIQEVKSLQETSRNKGGFGSTGLE